MTAEMGGLKGAVALVTGSSSGAGAEIAKVLAQHGASVAIHCRGNLAAAEAVAADISATGGKAACFRADLAKATEARRLATEVTDKLGIVTVLVNNAGPFADTAYLALEEHDWDTILAANLKAPYLLTQAMAPKMIQRGWGRIINIGATSALVRTHSVYGLAKAALLHLTESLALELAPAVTVNAVVPSQIASARTDRMPAYKSAAISGTPLRRLVTEHEIARMVAIMCSSDFDFVTGRSIIMDGGRTIPRFPKLGAIPES